MSNEGEVMSDRVAGKTEARVPRGVLCVGAIMVDAICRIPRLPERGEGVVCSERVMRLGGCAFNSGNVVRQLGAPCFLLAPVGRGVHADFVRSELAALGLAALEVETQLDCGVCTCLVEPDGERTMITAPGIERKFSPAWFEDVDTEGFGALLASGYEIEGAGGDAIIGFAESHPELEFYYAPGPRIMGVDAGKHERINALRPVWHLNDLEALQYTGAESVDAAGGGDRPRLRQRLRHHLRRCRGEGVSGRRLARVCTFRPRRGGRYRRRGGYASRRARCSARRGPAVGGVACDRQRGCCGGVLGGRRNGIR